MPPTDSSDLTIDIGTLYQMIGMLTAENAALKLDRAQNQQIIAALSAQHDQPSDSVESTGRPKLQSLPDIGEASGATG